MNSPSRSATEQINQRRAALREHIGWLCGLVEDKIEVDQVSEELKSQVQKIVGKVAVDFDELMQLRREDGFYESLIEKSPPAQSAIGQLRKDYEAMASELPDIGNQLIEEDHALKTRKRLHKWLLRLDSLDHREFDLLQNVWNTDIGAED